MRTQAFFACAEALVALEATPDLAHNKVFEDFEREVQNLKLAGASNTSQDVLDAVKSVRGPILKLGCAAFVAQADRVVALCHGLQAFDPELENLKDAFDAVHRCFEAVMAFEGVGEDKECITSTRL